MATHIRTITVFHTVDPYGDLPKTGFVNVEDAGVIMGVTGETIRRWIAAGQLTAFEDVSTYGRQGWRWVIPVEELAKLRVKRQGRRLHPVS